MEFKLTAISLGNALKKKRVSQQYFETCLEDARTNKQQKSGFIEWLWVNYDIEIYLLFSLF